MRVTANGETLNDAHLDELIARARATGAREVQVETTSGDQETDRWLTAKGFRPGPEIVAMERTTHHSVEKPVVSAGITLRLFEQRDGEAVHDLLDTAYSSWDSTYRPLDLDSWLSRMTGDAEFDPAFGWVAEDDRGVVGCALFWSSGWLKDLAVAPRARRRGIAEALLRRGLYGLAAAGIGQTGLKVDASNPTGAIPLYEKLGFVVTRREVAWALRL